MSTLEKEIDGCNFDGQNICQLCRNRGRKSFGCNFLWTEFMSTLEREKEVGGCNLDGQNLEYGKGTW